MALATSMAAPPEAHDRVGAVRAKRLDPRADLRFDRVAPDAVEHGRAEPFAREVRARLRDRRQRREPAIGDDQRPLLAGFPQRGADELGRAGPELNASREVVLMNRHGHGSR